MASFLNPDLILKHIGIIQPGMRVADLGCGGGYFSVALARLVGDQGTIYAVDILDSALDSARRKGEKAGLANIEFVRANLEQVGSSNIPERSVEAAFLANTLFESDKKGLLLKEAKRILREGGFLVVIDWNPHASIGPKAGAYGISKEEMTNLVKEAGFTLEKEFSVDAYHYGLLFRA